MPGASSCAAPSLRTCAACCARPSSASGSPAAFRLHSQETLNLLDGAHGDISRIQRLLKRRRSVLLTAWARRRAALAVRVATGMRRLCQLLRAAQALPAPAWAGQPGSPCASRSSQWSFADRLEEENDYLRLAAAQWTPGTDFDALEEGDFLLPEPASAPGDGARPAIAGDVEVIGSDSGSGSDCRCLV